LNKQIPSIPCIRTDLLHNTTWSNSWPWDHVKCQSHWN
jgi:hypothetical protein